MIVEKKLYSEQVLDIIKQDLYDGILIPGEKINEFQLAQRLGISRAPIREALCLLERDGLIVSTGNKGKAIKKLTPEQVFDTYMTGAILEANGIRKTCHLYKEEDFEQLKQLLESIYPTAINPNQTETITETETIKEITKKTNYSIDDQFHSSMLKYVRNEVLLTLSRQLPRRISKFLLTKYWQKLSSPKDFYKRHYELYQVLLMQKPLMAEEAIISHYADLAERVIKLMKSDD